jgi:hypothetical protein
VSAIAFFLSIVAISTTLVVNQVNSLSIDATGYRILYLQNWRRARTCVCHFSAVSKIKIDYVVQLE